MKNQLKRLRIWTLVWSLILFVAYNYREFINPDSSISTSYIEFALVAIPGYILVDYILDKRKC